MNFMTQRYGALVVLLMSLGALQSEAIARNTSADAPTPSAADQISATAAPAVTLSAKTLAFANQAVNTSSAAKTVSLKNSGTASLTLTSIALTGSEAHDFALTKNCGTTLAAGASCNISVAFTPIATGAKTSTVSISDNASGSPQKIALSGTGIAVTATPKFTPAGGTYDTTQSVTITDATSGAAIYYTTNGSTPTTTSARYSGAFKVAGTTALKAIALAAGDAESAVASASYTITSVPVTAGMLHSFFGNPNDGQFPVAGLVAGSDGDLYGTTQEGGAYGNGNVDSGTVFKVTTSGIESIVHSFGSPLDGNVPLAALLPDGHGGFYGTTYGGGTGVTGGYGTVFKISATGTESLFHSFPDAYIQGMLSDGERPYSGLIADSAGNVYGTTSSGQNSTSFTYGTVFKLTPTGVESVIHTFGLGSDGRSPLAALTLGKDGNLWGTTAGGGKYGLGTVFKTTAGGSETVVHSFGNGTDGIGPVQSLTQASDGNFYGTTPTGGLYGQGTVFKVTPTGAETVLHSFGIGTDGVDPQAPLIEGRDGNLYGTTMVGGAYAPSGTVFKITTGGVETVIYSFPGSSQGFPYGEQPTASLLQGSDGSLFGTTKYGGAYGLGGVFVLYRIVPLLASPTATTTSEPTSQ